jgi:malate dehydrogenase
LLKQGSAFYAPASAVVEMAGAVLHDTHAVLPVCASLQGEYGLRDVCLGVPAKLGAAGIEQIVELELTAEERAALGAAAAQVRDGLKSLRALSDAPR